MDILKISIVVAVIGIMALFFMTQYSQQDISKIGDLKIGQMYKIQGTVNSVYVSKDDHVFLKVSDNTGDVDVVAFKSANIDVAYDLVNGNSITVYGKVEEYKDKLEIIAKEISRV